MRQFNINDLKRTKYIFFTGKGGVGKTSIACSSAVTFADMGYKVLLVSTDPASNLQDVFDTELSSQATPIKGVDNLFVSNLDPIKAAEEYKEKVVGPFRGKLPDVAIQNMEEQLAGSCTVEIAAFNEFTSFLADDSKSKDIDYIVFDTAPTGHTLRLLQLPTAWDAFISESTHGNSCLGQLSGFEDQKDNYKIALRNLADESLTTMVLVARPEMPTLVEADRASKELAEIGIINQILLVNGVMEDHDDELSKGLYNNQQQVINNIPRHLKNIEVYQLPLRSYNITGLEAVRNFFVSDTISESSQVVENIDLPSLKDLVEDIISNNKRIVFTMGKGGVGKSSIANALALALSNRNIPTHLASTDPAAVSSTFVSDHQLLEVSYIDEKNELENYQNEVLAKARETMDEDQLSYIEEDLRSPCTQEIAVFQAFAKIVEKSENQVVIIDTAPTGHTLLLIDSTMSYHKEVSRTQGNVPKSVQELLPKLRDPKLTEVIIIALAQTTPVFEAMRLQQDLKRAEIAVRWWVINNTFVHTSSENALLKAKAQTESEWISKVNQHTQGKVVLVDYTDKEITNEVLLEWTN